MEKEYEEVDIVAKILKSDDLPENGLYYIVSENIYKDALLVLIEDSTVEENERIFISCETFGDEVKPMSNIFLGEIFTRGYTHYMPYKPQNTYNTPDNWYIEYERSIEIKERYHPILKTTIYSFYDAAGEPIEFFKDDKDLIHVEKISKDFKYFIPGIVGWSDFKFPKDLIYNDEIIFNKSQAEFHIEHLMKMSESYDVVFPEFMIKHTDRGFPYVDLKDYNDEKLRFQSSSNACEYRIWYGRAEPLFKYQDEEYYGNDFAERILKGEFEDILNLNPDIQTYVEQVRAGIIEHNMEAFPATASCLFSPYFELSVYHAKAFANKLQEIIDED